MFKLCIAEVYAPFNATSLPKSNRVLITLRYREHTNIFLPWRTSSIHTWAIMILGQTVRSTEVTTTIGALERHECFFPTFLALHVSRTPFLLKETVTVYMFLSENAVFPSMWVFHCFSQEKDGILSVFTEGVIALCTTEKLC